MPETTPLIKAALNLRGGAGFDVYRVTVTGEIYFLEMNSVPRVSSTSECAIICQEHNILFDNILIEYIDTIIKRISSHEKK